MEKEKITKGFVYDAFDLIHFTWKNKWLLIGISVVAFIASSIISSLITPRFRSNVIMFPTASISVSKNLVETDVVTSDTKDILTFGEDDDAERLLQILHSDKVRQHVIDQFNLMDHYEIDTASNYPLTKLYAKYKSNISFRRTEFTSIEIEVLDEVPEMAAMIANSIADYVDSVFYEMRISRARSAFQIVEEEYLSTKANIDRITDSLNTIRSFGITDYSSQSEGLNRAYAEAITQGRTSAVRIIEERLDILSKYGSIYDELTNSLENELRRYTSLKSKYAAAKVNLESNITNIFIVDRASVAERKALPKRSVIVMITTLSTFALALLLLIIIENIKART